MSICPNCNTNLPEDSAFCISCGTKLDVVAPTSPNNFQPKARHCPKCNSMVSDDSMFCISCGTKVSDSAPQVTHTHVNNVNPKKLHCPNCKSHNITLTTESSVDGAFTTQRGRFSSTTVSNTHRNFWVCTDCGTKFRNIQNLAEEIEKVKKSIIAAVILTILSGLTAIFFISKSSSNPVGGYLFLPFTIGTVIFFLVAFILIFVYKSRRDNMLRELAYLQQNCFN